MTTTNLLVDYIDGFPTGTPVLVLQPNGDKLPCSPTIDADGTLVLVPERESEPIESLSTYAFSRHGNDARLYNGIRDLEEAARRAGHLLRQVMKMHRDGYWVAPVSLMGEANVIVARIAHLAGQG